MKFGSSFIVTDSPSLSSLCRTISLTFSPLLTPSHYILWYVDWHLGEDGSILDMMYAIRADEAEHRDVNHVVSGLKEGQVNPLYNPEDQFDKVLKKYVKNMLEKGDRLH